MSRRMATAGDFWAGVGFVTLGAINLYGASKVFVPPVLSDMLGPRAFPQGLSVGLLLLGAIIIVRAAVRGGAPANTGPLGILLLSSAAMIAYVLAFEPLGYIASTTLFLAFLFFYLGERRHWLTAVVAVATTMVLFLGFGVALHVQLPMGPLGF